jgi:hypothetical protein
MAETLEDGSTSRPPIEVSSRADSTEQHPFSFHDGRTLPHPGNQELDRVAQPHEMTGDLPDSPFDTPLGLRVDGVVDEGDSHAE